ncbi:MAG: PQQ-dependent sugar dehydrogenase, partial [Propionibacteriaceae bacterium]|nr:PQQ-dependent sugar dehydrogenase [Propionibacteriaceae bacterium]
MQPVGNARTLAAGLVACAVSITLAACSAAPGPAPSTSDTAAPSTSAAAASSPSLPGAEPMPGTPFAVQNLGSFDEPWALAFLPGGSDALITERGGTLLLHRADGSSVEVGGVPTVVHEGQGGLGDVVVSPNFASDALVYLSWAAAGEGGSGAEVGRGRLVVEGASARLDGFTTIWRQQPKVTGSGHYGHRLAFSPDGQYLFVTSGERQKFDPAQDPGSDLGKIIRMNPDGTDARHWTLGHRNPLGIAFDAAGNLWSSEMGPQGGDELNLIEQGR